MLMTKMAGIDSNNTPASPRIHKDNGKYAGQEQTASE
jgi:hypothetical protein